MKTIFSLLAVFSILFISISSASTAKDNNIYSMDELYKKRIIGKWVESEPPYVGISSFEEGGTYRAWMYGDAERKKLLFTAKGKWWIERGKLYNTVSEMEPLIPELMTGMPSIDIIVDITDAVITLIDERGVQYTNKKIKE